MSNLLFIYLFVYLFVAVLTALSVVRNPASPLNIETLSPGIDNFFWATALRNSAEVDQSTVLVFLN